MDEEPTCGRGLGQTSVVPAGLAAVAAGLAQNLEVHVRALVRNVAIGPPRKSATRE